MLRAVAGDAAVMGEEIFGPVLPVLTFDDLSEVTDAINAGDKPLALYLFTAPTRPSSTFSATRRPAGSASTTR